MGQLFPVASFGLGNTSVDDGGASWRLSASGVGPTVDVSLSSWVCSLRTSVEKTQGYREAVAALALALSVPDLWRFAGS